MTGVNVILCRNPPHLFATVGVCFPSLPAVLGEQPVAAVDIEVVYLTDDSPVEHQLTRVAHLPVHWAAGTVLYHGLDAAATERVPALDGNDRLPEDLAAHGAQEGLRLLHKLGRPVGRRHDLQRPLQQSSDE